MGNQRTPGPLQGLADLFGYTGRGCPVAGLVETLPQEVHAVHHVLVGVMGEELDGVMKVRE